MIRFFLRDTFFLAVILLSTSPTIHSQSDTLPPIKNIGFVLDSCTYNKIPDWRGSKVNKPLFYFNNLSKPELSQYVEKITKSGFKKIYGYKWSRKYGFQYGFIKGDVQLRLNGYYKDKKKYGIEVKVTKHKSDSLLEKGELNSDQLISLINKSCKKVYTKERFFLQHIYMQDLWDKMKAQVVVLKEKANNAKFNNFIYQGEMYLVQNQKVCRLGEYTDRGSLIYNLIDFDKDGYYELEQIRYIGFGIIYCEKTVFKDVKVVDNDKKRMN